jgi:glutathionyl-hydroquinone reductase
LPDYKSNVILDLNGPEDWVKQFINCIHTSEKLLEKHKYLCGNKMTAADVSLYSEISLFEKIMKVPDDNWISHFSQV